MIFKDERATCVVAGGVTGLVTSKCVNLCFKKSLGAKKSTSGNGNSNILGNLFGKLFGK